MSEATEAIAEIAAPAALDIKAFGPVETEAEAVAQFTRSVMMAFGGLDVVVNLVPLTVPRLPPFATTADIERLVVERLILPCLLSKIAANRMALVLTEGLVLNVAVLAPPVEGPTQAFASVVKAAMTAMTRAQAQEWAGKAIRFNAIAPQTLQISPMPSLAGEPEVAALALHLASGRGKALSGLVFGGRAAAVNSTAPAAIPSPRHRVAPKVAPWRLDPLQNGDAAVGWPLAGQQQQADVVVATSRSTRLSTCSTRITTTRMGRSSPGAG